MIDLSSFKDHQITGNVYLRVALLVMKHYYSDQFDEIFSKILSLLMNEVSNIWIEEGKIKGKIEALIESVKAKYNNVSNPLASILKSIKDEEILNNLFREVILCNNMSEFQHKLEKIRAAEA